MPELPEVETIRRELDAYIVDRTVRRATVLDPKLTLGVPVHEFEFRLVGQRVEAVDRRGKYLLLRLSDRVLVLHLMMSGRVHLRPADAVQPHTRLILALDRDPALHFVDVRRFGRAWALDEADLHTVIGQLGPEPLDPDFDWRTLRDGFRNRTVAVKSALLDQRKLAGVGNIYADEALFSARIHPETPVDHISTPKLKALAQGIVDVLESGIANHGTSFSTFETSRGTPGSNQDHLRVFRRTGQPCPHCARPIRRIVVAQRSTHYCSNCQRRPRA